MSEMFTDEEEAMIRKHVQSCKRINCWGRGYTGTTLDGRKVVCKCVYEAHVKVINERELKRRGLGQGVPEHLKLTDEEKHA